ncbi:dorsal-ventral patterning protein Sog-like isoform X2 [Oppia nitens]|uniref:dorsal-ventral patterning protein Sog-like isoform X2 n=1 Tax=Oppia nitens TaxID=1686743 RepID=UPI0023DA4409|nr:dorsal-ventral patterning protein Sog-like isoform X2 [Oppia nitens]
MRHSIGDRVLCLKKVTLLVTCVCLTASGHWFGLCEARKRWRPPLIEDVYEHRHQLTVPSNSISCPFGNETHEVGDRWKPNLQPFGVYYCIRCECIAVQRKSRVVAKVRCKNIKNECPKPSCDDPVLLPERCCKSCPGDEDPTFNETTTESANSHTAADNNSYNNNNSNDSSTKGSPVPVDGDDSQMTKKFINDDQQNNIIGEPTYKCYYEAKIYEEGSQWKTERDDCEMCFCQRGRVKCEQEVCPELNCTNQTSIAGSCCPVCSNQLDTVSNNQSTTTKGCYLDGDKKFHLAGSKWHPYLPPFGFDKCSLCTCLAESLTIQCERNIVCPALTCPEQEAYRENPMDCCKRCPNALPVKSIVSVDQLGDQRSIGGGLKSPHELMALGGCKFRGRVYPNGDEWHPTVQPFGEVKCVKCRCKDGRSNCKRIVCPRITACSIVINRNDECCPICADDMDGMMMKNQPENPVHMRKRGKKRRRNNGRRALHRQSHRSTVLTDDKMIA